MNSIATSTFEIGPNALAAFALLLVYLLLRRPAQTVQAAQAAQGPPGSPVPACVRRARVRGVPDAVPIFVGILHFNFEIPNAQKYTGSAAFDVANFFNRRLVTYITADPDMDHDATAANVSKHGMDEPTRNKLMDAVENFVDDRQREMGKHGPKKVEALRALVAEMPTARVATCRDLRRVMKPDLVPERDCMMEARTPDVVIRVNGVDVLLLVISYPGCIAHQKIPDRVRNGCSCLRPY
jgi:hypothetical protein